MSQLQSRLVNCFSTVFPDLDTTAIPTVSQDTLADWDSVAAITLVTVIEEEFQLQIDMEVLPDLNSFPLILQYLERTADEIG